MIIQSHMPVQAPFAARAQKAPTTGQTAPKDTVESRGLDEILETTADVAASLAAKLPDHVPGEVLVKLDPGTSLADMQAFAQDYEATLVERFDVPQSMKKELGGELVLLKMRDGVSTAQGMAALETDGRVLYAASNDILQTVGNAQPVVPNDLDNRLWGLNNPNDADIDAPEAWAVTTGSRTNGPVIAVIDTGVDYNHPDLRNNMWTNAGEIAGNGVDDDGNGVVDDVHGFNAINDSGDPMDDNAHGTHCSGTIAAEGNNGTGVVGVNWEARIMGVKFLSGSGSGTTAGAIKGVLYATANGARITSNSWGGGGFNQALYDALKASPALHIFAAGNESNNNDRRGAYPASYDLENIVSVAAIDRNDRVAGFSNYGATSVDIGAPGVDIYSTTPGGRYASFSGTSMACPHVAGVAGLIATAFPEATNDEIKARLYSGAVKTAALDGKVATGGRVNAANAVETDTTAPSAPGNPTAQAEGTRKVALSWTAPGDDGDNGTATLYEIRYSDQPIESAEGFEAAIPVEAPAPETAGTTQRVEVRLPPSGSERTLHFAIRAFDNAANASGLATAAATVPAAAVAFDGSDLQAQGSWGQVEVDGRTGVWTDSPDGNYRNGADDSLTSREFSLKGLRNATLVFDSKYSLENGEDKVVVEVHNGGWFSWWRDMAEFTGDSEWKTHTVDLSRFDGDDVRVRFRITSDGSNSRDGMYLDNIQVVGDR